MPVFNTRHLLSSLKAFMDIFETVNFFVLSLHYSAHITHQHTKPGWKKAWDLGIKYIEESSPAFIPNTKAIYHPVSWSWIAGGICDKCTSKDKCGRIYDIFRDNIATPVGCRDDMFIGRVPKHVRKRVCRLERDRKWWNQHQTLTQNIFGTLESYVLCAMGNSDAWRNICLPSSNGVFTAHSVAKVYGALANGGIVDGARILSSDIVDHIFNTIQDERHFLHNEASKKNGEPARLGIGFAPWALPSVHDPRVKYARRCIYHSGMGGFHAYADPTRNLAMCVFSNLYEPLAHLKGNQAVPEFISDMTRIIRDEIDAVVGD